MTSSQSPETSLINGQLGTNEGSAFSTRHVHVIPIVDRVSSKVTPRHPVAKRCTAADYESGGKPSTGYRDVLWLTKSRGFLVPFCPPCPRASIGLAVNVAVKPRGWFGLSDLSQARAAR
jgi:hypothetical protein